MMRPELDANPRWFPVPVSAPPVGSEFLIPNGGRGFWVVHALSYRLATSAAGANRATEVQAFDGSAAFYRMPTEVNQGANLTFNYAAFDGSPMSTAAVSIIHLAWPTNGVVLPIGCSLRSVTVGLDVADQYSNIVAFVEELSAGFGREYVPSTPSTMDERY